MCDPTEPPLWQFWWNWLVQFAVAVGTLAVAISAVAGERIRVWLFPTRLRLRLVPGDGVYTPIQVQTPAKSSTIPGTTRNTFARYHHSEAFNEARWPYATGAQVYITRIESLGPDQQMHVKWTGAIPVLWQYQEVQPLARTLGPPYNCALCSVVKDDKCLDLHPLTTPFSFQSRFTAPVDITVTLQIRSDDGVSPERRFRISWDGEWHDGEREMAHHFVVRDLGDAEQVT